MAAGAGAAQQGLLRRAFDVALGAAAEGAGAPPRLLSAAVLFLGCAADGARRASPPGRGPPSACPAVACKRCGRVWVLRCQWRARVVQGPCERLRAVLMACGSLERPADPRSSSSFIEGCALAARAQPSAATRGRARARRWRARCRPCGRVWRAARRSVVNTARGREEGARAGPARELLGGAAGAPPAGPAMPSRALASCSRPRRCESRRAPPRRVG